jgi:hypothetical protein
MKSIPGLLKCLKIPPSWLAAVLPPVIFDHITEDRLVGCLPCFVY